jgi:hypothetical protein
MMQGDKLFEPLQEDGGQFHRQTGSNIFAGDFDCNVNNIATLKHIKTTRATLPDGFILFEATELVSRIKSNLEEWVDIDS